MTIICETYWKEKIRSKCNKCCNFTVPDQFKDDLKILLEKIINNCPNRAYIKRDGGRPKFNFVNKIN